MNKLKGDWPAPGFVVKPICKVRSPAWFWAGVTFWIIASPGFAHAGQPTAPPTGFSSPYSYSKDHDRDGIGKLFMGREIAQVMGHEASDWLERPEREAEE